MSPAQPHAASQPVARAQPEAPAQLHQCQRMGGQKGAIQLLRCCTQPTATAVQGPLLLPGCMLLLLVAVVSIHCVYVRLGDHHHGGLVGAVAGAEVVVHEDCRDGGWEVEQAGGWVGGSG